MNRNDVVVEIRRLQLPPDEYVVVGGAALTARGLRETADIDLVVTPALFEQLQRAGWRLKTRPNGRPGLRNGSVEAYLDVNSETFGRTTPWLLQHCEWVDGIPLVDLESLRNFKLSYGRPKDSDDLRLIEQHLSAPRPAAQRGPRFCVGAVVLREDTVLFVRQSPGHSLAGQWSIPWGVLEDGESPSHAAVREVAEEAAVCVCVDGFLGVQSIPAPWAGQVALLFQCHHTSGCPTPDGRETDRARYLRADELANLGEPVEPFCSWLAMQVLAKRVRALTNLDDNPYATAEGYFYRAV